MDDLESDADELDELYTLARWNSERSAGNEILLAASNGNHLAEAYLSVLYFNGCASFDSNKAEANRLAACALPWLQSEMLKRNPYAIFHVASCYFDGRGVMQNILEAETIARRYMKLGHDETSLLLAKIEMRRGPKRYPHAKLLVERIVEDSDHPEAMYQLGMYEMHHEGPLRDEDVAFQYFQAAAKQGHREATYQAGLCTLEGLGTFRDEVKAARYFRRAADCHLEEAQVAYAKCCKEGHGVVLNYPRAAMYYSCAANKGNVLAVRNLGVMYELGRGVPQNKQQAIMYYKQAAERGDRPAQLSMRRLVDEMKAVNFH
eukprot:gene8191-9750_t